MQVRREVQTRRPCSSVISMSYVAKVRPPCNRVATPVTYPEVAERWWVAFSSMPTAMRSGPAWTAAPTEPSVSASTAEAPPCSSPYGCVLPSDRHAAHDPLGRDLQELDAHPVGEGALVQVAEYRDIQGIGLRQSAASTLPSSGFLSETQTRLRTCRRVK